MKLCEIYKANNDFTAQNKFVLTVNSELGKHGKLDLLVETGSAECLLKIDHINQEAFMDANDKIKLGGAFGGQETTFGYNVIKFWL